MKLFTDWFVYMFPNISEFWEVFEKLFVRRYYKAVLNDTYLLNVNKSKSK